MTKAFTQKLMQVRATEHSLQKDRAKTNALNARRPKGQNLIVIVSRELYVNGNWMLLAL